MHGGAKRGERRRRTKHIHMREKGIEMGGGGVKRRKYKCIRQKGRELHVHIFDYIKH